MKCTRVDEAKPISFFNQIHILVLNQRCSCFNSVVE